MKNIKSTSLFLGVASAMAFAQDGAACIPFVNGVGDYDKHCYNSGLIDMEKGKCYTMNADRAREGVPQWINNIVSQTWWWSETECIEEPASSSSVEPESSSSEVVSSSSEEPVSSSSEVVSSSSEEPVSSSSEVVSSSSEEPVSSSSEVVSSSSVEPVSSSSEVAAKCVTFVNGSGDYNGKCFNAGLNDMTEGKCYKLNPDRGEVRDLWINNRAVDSWWWVETSCGAEPVSSSSVEESSSSVEESSSSVEESSSSVEESSSSVEESSSSVEESSSSVEESSSSVEESSSSVEESSSSVEESSSSVEESSSSVEESSSSVEESSSSVEESSSSVEESSSSVEESSSSVEESSSSVEESSSSVEESSSSEVVAKCVTFVNGSGDYNGKCFNAGLNDMTEGKCYKLNPDRGEVRDLWINNRAVDSWWWVETACGAEPASSSSVEESSSSVEESSSSVEESSSSVEESSSSVEESSSSVEESSSSIEESSSSVEESSSSIEESSSSVESSSSEVSSSSVESSSSEVVVAKCVAFVNGSGDYNGKCFNSGLNDMAEGKCYKLNPDRGEVREKWINNRAVDSWWWVETACFDEPIVKPAPKTENPILKSNGRDNGTTAIAATVEAKSNIAFVNNTLSIASTSNGAKTVKVFSVRGDVLLSKTFSGATMSLDMSKFAGKGAVILRLVEGRKVLATKRIAVR